MPRNAREFTCECCGKKFTSIKKIQRYCSKECQYSAIRNETLTIECQYCGKVFQAQEGKLVRKFCSLDCNNKSIGINKLNNPPAMNSKCACCGKEFYLPKCRLPKDGEYRYCSTKCKGDYKIILYMKKYQAENGIDDMKEWLYQNYVVESKTYREMGKELGINSSRIFAQWLNYFGLHIKHGSEAIKPQWLGEKGIRRKLSSTGTNSVHWNPNKTILQRHEDRKLYGYQQWIKAVFGRDWYTCQITGVKGNGNLVAHHLNSYHDDIKNRLNIDNGVTILSELHKQFHRQYGYGGNTKEQFEEFKRNYKLISTC